MRLAFLLLEWSREKRTLLELTQSQLNRLIFTKPFAKTIVTTNNNNGSHRHRIRRPRALSHGQDQDTQPVRIYRTKIRFLRNQQRSEEDDTNLFFTIDLESLTKQLYCFYSRCVSLALRSWSLLISLVDQQSATGYNSQNQKLDNFEHTVITVL